MTLEQGLAMEQRIFESAVEIIKNYLGDDAKCIMHGGKGKRETANTRDAAYDELGIDIHAELPNKQTVIIQVKCGTKDNYEKWGKERKSFTLGDPDDITWPRLNHWAKVPHLFLSGYELEEGKISPYVLINWQFFLRSAIDHKYWANSDKLHVQLNWQRPDKRFCWMNIKDIPQIAIVSSKVLPEA